MILIGQSWGAALAVLYAADHPGKVERIVFTSPGVLKPEREREPIDPPPGVTLTPASGGVAEAAAKLLHPRSIAILLGAKAFGLKIASDAEADGLMTALEESFTKALVCDPARRIAPEGGAGGYVQFRTTMTYDALDDPRPKLAGKNIPMLMTGGSCEPIDWASNKEFSDLFPDNRFVLIDGAGHQSYVEQPEAYFSAIREFLVDGAD